MIKKIESPVLFDANIFINFKGQLKFLFSLFENVLVHKQVIEEVLETSIKNELDLLMRENNSITIVEDMIIEDKIEQLLYEECDKELKNVFNIRDYKDLGEYKTLLYAKFNEVKLLSSQDTTVWRFVTSSSYFNDIDCITIQDLSYLIYLNANGKKDRKLAKALYSHFGRNEHPFDDFNKYMLRNDNKIPKYIEFENNRINNYNKLLNGYVKFYSTENFCNIEEIERDLVNAARQNFNTCIDCLYSRINSANVDLLKRNCSLRLELFDEDCTIMRESFSQNIRTRK